MSERSRVLIVDDDPALLDALPVAIKLRAPGVQVDTCDAGLAALDLIDRVDYDVIITDIKMPGLDGLSLLNRIAERRPETPTILISGHGEHDLTIQALRGGAYDFIQKPIDRDYFMASLDRALQANELRREVAVQRAALERQAENLAEQVEERTRQLRLANEAKDEFLGLISHELRTPLTVVNGGIRLMRAHREKLDAESHEELLADMEREGERLKRMVEDLFVLARAEFDPTAAEPLAIDRLAQKVATQESTHLGRPVVVDCPERIPLVAGDDTYIERVITNLISNSHKYSEPGGTIEIALVNQSVRTVRVTVRDRGAEIADGLAAQIFERFFRTPDAQAKANGGGMGLTICRRLIESMGGEIWASPRDGGGLEVHFTLRRYSPEGSAECDGEDAETLVESEAEPQPA